jgi:hypothetical protein
LAGAKFPDPRLEAFARHMTHLQTEAAQNAAKAEFDITQLA